MSRLWSGEGDALLKEKTVLVAVRESWVEPFIEGCRKQAAVALVVQSAEELFPLLQFGDPDYLILDEGFGGEGGGKNAVLEAVQQMTSERRRDLFVILIGPEFKTGDHLTAFALSVNVVLHPQDLASWIQVLERSYRQWSRLYQGFFQVRREVNGY